MRHSIDQAPLRTQLDSVRTPSQPLRTSANREHPILVILRRAHSETSTKQEGAAAAAEVPPSQYGDGLNGAPSRNYAVTWLWAQSDLLLLRFVELLLEARGLTPDNKKAVRANRIIELMRLLTDE